MGQRLARMCCFRASSDRLSRKLDSLKYYSQRRPLVFDQDSEVGKIASLCHSDNPTLKLKMSKKT